LRHDRPVGKPSNRIQGRRATGAARNKGIAIRQLGSQANTSIAYIPLCVVTLRAPSRRPVSLTDVIAAASSSREESAPSHPPDFEAFKTPAGVVAGGVRGLNLISIQAAQPEQSIQINEGTARRDTFSDTRPQAALLILMLRGVTKHLEPIKRELP